MGLLEPIVFTLGVIMGTGSTITIKVIYGLEAIGLSGHLQKFEKPLTTTWIMFLAMMLALPAFWIKRYYQLYRRNNAINKLYNNNHNNNTVYTSLKSNGINFSSIDELYPVEEDVAWKTYFLLVIPSAFDLLGTALSSIGLLFTTVSVYQLLRCSVIIVTALLKTTVLGHKLTRYMWVGIMVNTVAMIMVAMTSWIDPSTASGEAATGTVESESRDPLVGIIFILLSCIVQGSQYVFEEKVMAVDNAPPLVVVGMEGVWGSILVPLVVFPWAYILPGNDVDGCFENVLDAWYMTVNSTNIQIVLVLFTVTVFLYNIFCIYVTFLLDSVWHSILDNFRPVSVWATDLLLFYVFTNGRFGEEWSQGSYLQLIGLILLFVGTAVYNKTIQLPGFDYSDIDDSNDYIDVEVNGTPGNLQTTPYLARSPLLNFRSVTPKPANGSAVATRQFGQPSNWPSYGSTLQSPQMNGISIGQPSSYQNSYQPASHSYGGSRR